MFGVKSGFYSVSQTSLVNLLVVVFVGETP